jgi:hypothetical protein
MARKSRTLARDRNRHRRCLKISYALVEGKVVPLRLTGNFWSWLVLFLPGGGALVAYGLSGGKRRCARPHCSKERPPEDGLSNPKLSRSYAIAVEVLRP